MYELVTTTAAGSLRVQFQKKQDRFSHHFVVERDAIVHAAAATWENNDEVPWPLSPPVQEVHQQGDLLFLTGAAGTSYWSASVSVPEPGVIEFDWACKYKVAKPTLSNLYGLQSAELSFALGPNMTMDLTQRTARLEVIAPEGPGTARWVYRVSLLTAGD